ncbi:Intraflagellar transport protein 88 [Spiromyces aspiralis]|uniref:Intraflagellar transport protein 88 n=1 Tax=Spiromyces aspiralis TaxID=68401 RepID=A0ACC1HIL3_9FUNG|nr:Intraflagellar transport protein 88 [Spiromyces aspiralis]
MDFITEQYSYLLNELLQGHGPDILTQDGLEALTVNSNSGNSSISLDSVSDDQVVCESQDQQRWALAQRLLHSRLIVIEDDEPKLTNAEGSLPQLTSSTQFYPSPDARLRSTQKSTMTRARLRLPTLQDIRSSLVLLRGIEGPHTQNNDLGWLLLAESVAAMCAHLSDQLLGMATDLSEGIEYWKARDASPLSLCVYFVQSLPGRMLDVLQRASAAVYLELVSVRGGLRLPRIGMAGRSTLASSSVAKAGLDFRRVLAGMWFLQRMRNEMLCKQRNLAAMRDSLAHRIGLLTQVTTTDIHGLGQDNGDNDDDDDDSYMRLARIAARVSLAMQLGCRQSGASQFPTPDGMTVAASISDIAGELERILDDSQVVLATQRKQAAADGIPPLLTRAWLPVTMGVLASHTASGLLMAYRHGLVEWISEAGRAIGNYIMQYITTPLANAYRTVRYGQHSFVVVSRETLRTDIAALEQMVVDFAAQTNDITVAAEIRERVRAGDLSDVMGRYSAELQNPIKNLLFGDLVRALMIQAQKVKVDVEQAMAALDKLLKANELNFAFLAAFPAALVLYGGWRLAARWVKCLGGAGGRRRSRHAILDIMHEIDKLLNNASTVEEPKLREQRLCLSPIEQGHLLCLTRQLRYHSRSLPDGATALGLSTVIGLNSWPIRGTFLRDVCDLENGRFMIEQRRRVLQRMYRLLFRPH